MLKLLVAVLAIAYPVLIYFGLAHLRPGIFGLILVLIVLLRGAGLNDKDRRDMLIPVIGILVYAIAVAVTDSETLLRFYPLMINSMMLVVFVHSLISPPPLIERISRARGMEIPPEGKIYVWRVTQIWCAFFALNGAIAAYTALYGSWTIWVLYNGLISYLAMGVLLAGEVIFRYFYKRRVARRAQAGG